MGFHCGELAAQRLAGLSERAEQTWRVVRDTFPSAAPDFLAGQRMFAVAAADAVGRMWTTLLTGPAGFVTVVDTRTMNVAAMPLPGDPLAAVLAEPTKVGTIAIEPATRRRMRVNGWSRPDNSGLQITADQIYANCPKYISQRSPHAEPAPLADHAVAVSTSLTPAQQRVIRAADTFFIGTRSAAGDVDASHRGGDPGFVDVGATELSWPDYTGNAMLMTLGNLQQQPAAGLLFVDWSSGTLLAVTGRAHVTWTPPRGAPAVVERVVHLSVDLVVQLDGASPLRWTPPAVSPVNP